MIHKSPRSSRSSVELKSHWWLDFRNVLAAAEGADSKVLVSASRDLFHCQCVFSPKQWLKPSELIFPDMLSSLLLLNENVFQQCGALVSSLLDTCGAVSRCHVHGIDHLCKKIQPGSLH